MLGYQLEAESLGEDPGLEEVRYTLHYTYVALNEIFGMFIYLFMS